MVESDPWKQVGRGTVDGFESEVDEASGRTAVDAERLRDRPAEQAVAQSDVEVVSGTATGVQPLAGWG